MSQVPIYKAEWTGVSWRQIKWDSNPGSLDRESGMLHVLVAKLIKIKLSLVGVANIDCLMQTTLGI